MGGPLFLAVVFGILIALPVEPATLAGRTVALLCLVIAAVFGCRVAYHLHMRRADAYGGAYTRPEVVGAARRRYLVMCVIYSVAAVYLAHLAVEAKGLSLPF